MPFTEQMKEAISIPALSLRPANNAFDNTNAAVVGPVDMMKFQRVMAHVINGVVSAGGTVLYFFQACATSNGSYANIASGAQQYQNTSNTEGTIEMRADQMPAGTRFLQLAILNGVANALVSASVYGYDSSYKPAGQWDVANVTRSAM